MALRTNLWNHDLPKGALPVLLSPLKHWNRRVSFCPSTDCRITGQSRVGLILIVRIELGSGIDPYNVALQLRCYMQDVHPHAEPVNNADSLGNQEQ